MKPLINDALWERLQSVLPTPPDRRYRFPGRKPLDQRKILTGILFVLKTGIMWDDLPADLGWGCGKTCRSYLQHWHRTGVWLELQAVLLNEFKGADKIDWDRALINASFARAPKRGGNAPSDLPGRSNSGSRPQLMENAQSIPRPTARTAANINSATLALDVFMNMPVM